MSTPYDPQNPEEPNYGDHPGGQTPLGPQGFGQSGYGPDYGQPPAFPPPPPYGQQYAPVTPQYAGWWTRVLARLIDSLLVVPVYLVGTLIFNSSKDAAGNPSGGGVGIFVVLVVAAIALGGWNRWYRAGRTGQSLGKSAMAIFLVFEATGQPIGPMKAFVRDLAHILDAICYIGYIVAAFHEKRQTFADMIMSTIVVTD